MTLFDATSSQQFLASATKAVGAGQQLYGSNEEVSQLEVAIRSGDADPGSLLDYSLVKRTGQLSVADHVGCLRPHRLRLADGDRYLRDDLRRRVTFRRRQLSKLLRARNDWPISVRSAGDWSGGGFPAFDPVELTEAGGVMDAIIANGLWIGDGTLPFSLQNGSVIYRTGVDNDTYVGGRRWILNRTSQMRPRPAITIRSRCSAASLSATIRRRRESRGWGCRYAFCGRGNVKRDLRRHRPTRLEGRISRRHARSDGRYLQHNELAVGHRQVLESFTAEQILAIVAQYYPPTGVPSSYDVSNQTIKSIPLVFFLDRHERSRTVLFSALTLDTQDATLFGLVPYEPFSYSPIHSAPTPPSLAGSTDPLPLTTRMDYLNVMADDGTIDGIVNTTANLSSFGSDTGTATFTARNGIAQVYLPVKTDLTGSLPVNAYFAQGGFGAAADGLGDLLSQEVTVTNASQDGLSWAYSLDTHVRVNLLVNDASNHFKRVEVIRPDGNAVVFDFAWEPTAGMFSPYGTPDGWSGRDANQTYVLRTLNAPGDDAGLSYELLFANGIVHTFGTSGVLQSVSDTSSGLTKAVGGGLPATLLAGTKDTADSPRYNLTLNWSNGGIGSLDYQTTNTTGTVHVIHTAVTYGGDDGNDVTALSKTDDGTPIPQFSYTAISAGSITQNGVTITRSGSVSSGSVTIATTLPGDAGFASGSSTSETYRLQRPQSGDIRCAHARRRGWHEFDLDHHLPIPGRLGLYGNGEPSWAKVTLVTNPDQSWVGYTYDASTGWVTGKVTPFQSGTWSPGGATSGDNLESYGYDPSLSGNGQGSDASLLVQPPDTVTDYMLGTQTGETFNNYRTPLYGSPVIVTRQALGDGSPTWATAGLFSTTTINAFDASSTTSVTGNLSVQKSGNGSSLTYTTTSSWFGTDFVHRRHV